MFTIAYSFQEQDKGIVPFQPPLLIFAPSTQFCASMCRVSVSHCFSRASTADMPSSTSIHLLFHSSSFSCTDIKQHSQLLRVKLYMWIHLNKLTYNGFIQAYHVRLVKNKYRCKVCKSTWWCNDFPSACTLCPPVVVPWWWPDFLLAIAYCSQSHRTGPAKQGTHSSEKYDQAFTHKPTVLTVTCQGDVVSLFLDRGSELSPL